MPRSKPYLHRSAKNDRGYKTRGGRTVRQTRRYDPQLQKLAGKLKRGYVKAHGPGVSMLANTHVYLRYKGGKGRYVGISNDLERRRRAHAAKQGGVIRRITDKPLPRIMARAIEQHLINDLRFRGEGPYEGVENIANSVSAAHPYYPDAMRYARHFVGNAPLKKDRHNVFGQDV